MLLPNLADPRIAAFFAIYGAVLMLAWVLGGGPERIGVYTLIGMFAVQLTLYSTIGSPTFDSVDAVSVVSDGVGFAGFTAIALKADRRWPLFAAAMQLISILAHLTHGFHAMLGQSYEIFKVFPTIGAITFLLVGLFFHRIRVFSRGFDRDWVPFKQYEEFRKLARESEQF